MKENFVERTCSSRADNETMSLLSLTKETKISTVNNPFELSHNGILSWLSYHSPACIHVKAWPEESFVP